MHLQALFPTGTQDKKGMVFLKPDELRHLLWFLTPPPQPGSYEALLLNYYNDVMTDMVHPRTLAWCIEDCKEKEQLIRDTVVLGETMLAQYKDEQDKYAPLSMLQATLTAVLFSLEMKKDDNSKTSFVEGDGVVE